MNTKIISPSFLSADMLNLADDVKMINESKAEWIHLDIMDGVFVPNISYGFPIVKAIRKATKKVLDVHLMIVEPDKYIDTFAEAGADILTVHVEATTHLHRTIQAIKAKGMKAGVALNPHTPLSSIEEIIEDVDMVLIMSVNPGYGGQSFIEHSFDKIKRLKKMIVERKSNAIIEVDGGVNLKNAKLLFDAGCDALVAGSSVFNSENPQQTIIELLNA
ncbi:MAG: ribulose-phosphate 3-epimerase [Bacteroidetes bacterium]|nr:ribulose-phosphate 3-epimerase [Bacteroidota bacterium]